MSAVFTVPAAARLPRPAAARRALLTVFFLGGFLALAVLFGGSAHAASGPDHSDRAATGAAAGPVLKTDSTDSTDSKAKGASQAELAEHRREARHAATTATAEKAVAPVQKSAEGTGKVTRPVGETAEGVTGSANLHGLTDQMGLSRHDASGDHSGHATDRGTGKPSGRYAGTAVYGPNGSAQHAGSRTAADAGPGSGPASYDTLSDDAHHGDGGPAHRLPPFDQTPSGPAAPASSSSQSAGPGHGPRGGGLHQLAGYVAGMEHFGRLQAGAVRAADSTPTRERSGDVLGFPG